MTYNLFIDDERDPIDITWCAKQDRKIYVEGEWLIARSWSEVCELVLTLGMPDLISFDHDLGKDRPTGYDITKHLVNLAIDSPNKYAFSADFRFLVHSKNPVGAENITRYLENFLRIIR